MSPSLARLLLLASASAVATSASPSGVFTKADGVYPVPPPSGDQLQRFNKWSAAFGKVWSDEARRDRALSAWLENDDKIAAHNIAGHSYSLGHNQFSDQTSDEFYASRLMPGHKFPSFPAGDDGERLLASLPAAIDWTTQNAVTPVKDQANCGSCWSFSTTGAIEGRHAIASGELVSLSEQDLVSCDSEMSGCNGGLPSSAMCWVRYFGLSKETDYPYTSGEGDVAVCKAGGAEELFLKGNYKPAVTVDGFQAVPFRRDNGGKIDVEPLKAAVAEGPVSIGIEADRDAFHLYKSGVLNNSTCGQWMDHAVLIVGYGHDDASGLDYWKVKNSWAADWGEDGYIRMVMGKDQCGVEANAVYPTGVKGFDPSRSWNSLNATKDCPRPKLPAPALPASFTVNVTDKSDNSTGIVAVSAAKKALLNTEYMTAGDHKLWLCDPSVNTTYDVTSDGFDPATCSVNPEGQACPWDSDQDVIMMGLTDMYRARTGVPCGTVAMAGRKCSVYTYDGDDSQEMWLTVGDHIPVKEVSSGASSVEYTDFVPGEPDESLFHVPKICRKN